MKVKVAVVPENEDLKICCPKCGTVWNTDEGAVGECEHLRFFYFDDQFVDFFGKWNWESYRDQVEKFKAKSIEENGFRDEIKIFERVESKDIGGIIYYEFDYAPMSQPFGFWGYDESVSKATGES